MYKFKDKNSNLKPLEKNNSAAWANMVTSVNPVSDDTLHNQKQNTNDKAHLESDQK